MGLNIWAQAHGDWIQNFLINSIIDKILEINFDNTSSPQPLFSPLPQPGAENKHGERCRVSGNVGTGGNHLVN